MEAAELKKLKMQTRVMKVTTEVDEINDDIKQKHRVDDEGDIKIVIDVFCVKRYKQKETVFYINSLKSAW